MLDTHCHIDLYPDPHRVLDEVARKRITTVAVTNLPSHFIQARPHVVSAKSVRLALGLHPLFANKHTKSELRKFRELAPATSYIGEVGLDFSSEGRSTADKQRTTFRLVLEAISDRPRFLTIHSRRAEAEVLDLLTEYRIKGAVFHWYSGPHTLVDKIVYAGHYFSVNPAMIRTTKGRSIIERIPRERILTETDGPYLQVGDRPALPADVLLVLDYLVTSWNMPQEQVKQYIWGNFQTILQPIREWQSHYRQQ
jgi:TatD DNase family protein